MSAPVNKTKPNKKVVYKHVVDSSYVAVEDWPKVSEMLNVELLADLCTILKPVGDHRRLVASHPRRTKRRKVTSAGSTPAGESDEVKQLAICCSYGLSACNRSLEAVIHRDQTSAVTDPTLPVLNVPAHHPDAVFVCKADLTTDLLYGHFPALCVLANKSRPGTRLIPLARGAEVALGLALALPRVGCVTLSDHPLTRALLEKVREHISPPTSQILLDTGHYKETVMKTLISSAPIINKVKSQIKDDKSQSLEK